jgi:stress response protein YsnF
MTIPVVAEKLNVTKKKVTDYVVITKIPVTEMQTIQVPVTYEKIIVERRKVGDLATAPTGLAAAASNMAPTTASSVNSPPETTGDIAQPTTMNQKWLPGSQKVFIVPVEREEVQVQKQPYVRDEVVVRKTPASKTKTIKEKVRAEKVETRSDSSSVKEVGQPGL